MRAVSRHGDSKYARKRPAKFALAERRRGVSGTMDCSYYCSSSFFDLAYRENNFNSNCAESFSSKKVVRSLWRKRVLS